MEPEKEALRPPRGAGSTVSSDPGPSPLGPVTWNGLPRAELIFPLVVIYLFSCVGPQFCRIFVTAGRLSSRGTQAR